MEEYVLEAHKQVIQDFVNENKIAISFRKAGVYTLYRLSAGCACKGHNVLEKSIKEKTLKNVDNPEGFMLSGLSGLIGHWKEEKGSSNELTVKLLGVYLSEYGKNRIQELVELGLELANANIVKISDQLIYLMSIDANGEYNGEKDPQLIAEAKAQYRKFSKYFLTGDYDIHDILDMEVNGANKDCIIKELKRPPVSVKEETALIAELNAALSSTPAITTREVGDEFKYIRHGAQINYPMYMKKHEDGEPLVLNVIKADTDIMMFESNAKPSIITDYDAYSDWYKKHNIIMKDVFSEGNDLQVINLLLQNQYGFFVLLKAIDVISIFIDKGDVEIDNTGAIKMAERLNYLTSGQKNAISNFYNHLKSAKSEDDRKRSQDAGTVNTTKAWLDRCVDYKGFVTINFNKKCSEFDGSQGELVNSAKSLLQLVYIDKKTRDILQPLF